MEQKIKNYLHEQMENFDENKILVLKGWVVLATYKSSKPNHAIDFVVYDHEKSVESSLAFWQDEDDIQDAYDDIIGILDIDFGIEL